MIIFFVVNIFLHILQDLFMQNIQFHYAEFIMIILPIEYKNCVGRNVVGVVQVAPNMN